MNDPLTAEPNGDAVRNLEERRHELEERKEKNNFELRLKELEIAEKQADRGLHSGKIKSFLVPVASAAAGAAATLGAAAMTGLFSVQESTVLTQAEASLAAQKFSYEMISIALSEPEPRDRALRLSFLLDVGLLDSLDREKIREYAEGERRRLDSGETEDSVLPFFQSSAMREFEEFEWQLPSSEPIQNAMVTTGLCSVEVTGKPDLETTTCLQEFLGDDVKPTDLYAAYLVPGTVSNWIQHGKPLNWQTYLELAFMKSDWNRWPRMARKITIVDEN